MMTSKSSLESARAALREHADKSDAEFLRRYFKTGPGQYGEGDRLIGVRVPAIRRVARRFRDLPLAETLVLLRSEIHEERLLALIILTEKYRRGTPGEQAEICREYLNHTRFINNWDLVDTSADRIVGAHLGGRSRRSLYRLARSGLLWERRIAVMATFHFIRNGEFAETLKIAGMLRYLRNNLWKGLKTPPSRAPARAWVVFSAWAAFALVVGFGTGILKYDPLPWPTALLLSFTLVVFPSLIEEAVFRGLLIPRDAADRGRAAVSIAFSTVVFVAWHPFNALVFTPSAAAVFLNPWFLVIVTALGVTCGYAYVVSKSIWVPVIIHWAAVFAWVIFLGGRNLVLDL